MPMSLLTAYSIYLPASDIRSVATAMTDLPQLLRIETTLWSPLVFAQNLGITYYVLRIRLHCAISNP
jgi:hypothetical protein